MKIAGPPQIDFIEDTLADLREMPPHRALDVAAGSGRVTMNLLLGLYKTVDLLDQCPQSIKEIKKLKGTTDKIGQVYPEKM